MITLTLYIVVPFVVIEKKNNGGFLICNIRALFQYINFPPEQNTLTYVLLEEVADSLMSHMSRYLKPLL